MGPDTDHLPHRRRPPRLLLLVFAASLALTGITGVVLTTFVGDQIKGSALAAVGSADLSLAQDFLRQSAIGEGSVGADPAAPTPSQVQAVDTQLQQLVAASKANAAAATQSGGRPDALLRIKIHGADDTVLFSDDAAVIGDRTPDDDLEAAIDSGERQISVATDLGPGSMPVFLP